MIGITAPSSYLPSDPTAGAAKCQQEGSQDPSGQSQATAFEARAGQIIEGATVVVTEVAMKPGFSGMSASEVAPGDFGI